MLVPLGEEHAGTQQDTTRGIRPRVVLVEDDLENRALLRQVLEAEGIEVLGEAGEGTEGVRIVRALHPDVVLMDLHMPGTGGIEATRPGHQGGGPSQVIVLTAYDGPLPTRSAHEVGAYAYLVKGCSPALMRDVIVQAYGRCVALGRSAGARGASRRA